MYRQLRRQRTPIPTNDLWIAALVLRHNLVLHARDKHFESVAQIARDTRAAAERARAGRLNADDLGQGTFSISNLGMFEIEHFVAIVNPPEAAILALGTAKEVPVVENGQLKSGWRLKMTLSADHRVTDGAEAARFLQEIKRLLQTPMALFL